jgi:hypothetical protein
MYGKKSGVHRLLVWTPEANIPVEVVAERY